MATSAASAGVGAPRAAHPPRTAQTWCRRAPAGVELGFQPAYGPAPGCTRRAYRLEGWWMRAMLSSIFQAPSDHQGSIIALPTDRSKVNLSYDSRSVNHEQYRGNEG